MSKDLFMLGLSPNEKKLDCCSDGGASAGLFPARPPPDLAVVVVVVVGFFVKT